MATTVYRSESYFEGWLAPESSHPSLFSIESKKFYCFIARKAVPTIVNQNRRIASKKKIRPAAAPQEESGIDQKITDLVNAWISESRENRRAEKAFSNERISAWKIMSSENPD